MDNVERADKHLIKCIGNNLERFSALVSELETSHTPRGFGLDLKHGQTEINKVGQALSKPKVSLKHFASKMLQSFDELVIPVCLLVHRNKKQIRLSSWGSFIWQAQSFAVDLDLFLHTVQLRHLHYLTISPSIFLHCTDVPYHNTVCCLLIQIRQTFQTSFHPH